MINRDGGMDGTVSTVSHEQLSVHVPVVRAVIRLKRKRRWAAYLHFSSGWRTDNCARK